MSERERELEALLERAETLIAVLEEQADAFRRTIADMEADDENEEWQADRLRDRGWTVTPPEHPASTAARVHSLSDLIIEVWRDLIRAPKRL